MLADRFSYDALTVPQYHPLPPVLWAVELSPFAAVGSLDSKDAEQVINAAARMLRANLVDGRSKECRGNRVHGFSMDRDVSFAFCSARIYRTGPLSIGVKADFARV